MAKKRKSGSGQYPLRLPDDLRVWVEKAAKDRNVSINAAILERLEQSFQTEDRLGGPRLARLLESIGVAMRAAGENAPEYDNPDALSNGRWVRRREAYQHAVKVAVAILEANTPAEDPIGTHAELVEVMRHKARNRQ